MYIESIQDKIEKCLDCELRELKINDKMVKNTGNLDAELFFVGTAPSYYNHTDECFMREDYSTNKVFMSGLESIGLQREDIYITNLVKCSTRQNEKPSEKSKQECSKYLIEELKYVKPKLIVAMGFEAISFMGGKKNTFFKLKTFDAFGIYHPAFINRNPMVRDDFMNQFQKIKDFIDKKKTLGDY